jgi:hypothetical protein
MKKIKAKGRNDAQPENIWFFKNIATKEAKSNF